MYADQGAVHAVYSVSKLERIHPMRIYDTVSFEIRINGYYAGESATFVSICERAAKDFAQLIAKESGESSQVICTNSIEKIIAHSSESR